MLKSTVAFIKKYWLALVGAAFILFTARSTATKRHADVVITHPQNNEKIEELQEKVADQLKTTPVHSSNLDEAIDKWNNI